MAREDEDEEEEEEEEEVFFWLIIIFRIQVSQFLCNPFFLNLVSEKASLSCYIFGFLLFYFLKNSWNEFSIHSLIKILINPSDIKGYVFPFSYNTINIFYIPIYGEMLLLIPRYIDCNNKLDSILPNKR